ncbi:MAG: gluconokinase [Desulfobulbaceae bacterium]|nr:MAG: gluconokinase [Desulfobulbaceae bacterium]
MGPMGCGKTTIGSELARITGWSFYDADDYHPEINRKKMAEGIPLDDNDRYPWLAELRVIIDDHQERHENMILACSALKQVYRNQLGIDQVSIFLVYLRGSFELLKQRVQSRSHDFMAKDLLKSQLETLEEPETGLVVEISAPPQQICETIINTFKDR